MARPTDSNEQLLCSFCGKSQRQVKQLIAGPGHAPHLETPGEFASLLEQFIADLR